MKPILTAAIVALLMLAAGCGGAGDDPDEAAVRRTITDYLAAVAAKEGRAACARLTTKAQHGIVDFRLVHGSTGDPSKRCAEIVARRRPGPDAERLRDPAISAIRIEGATATATVGGRQVKLEKVAGSWKIAEIGLATQLDGAVVPAS